jgi:hypothetical protein
MIQSLALSMQRQVKENKLVYSDDSTIDYLTNPPWALLAEAPLQNYEVGWKVRLFSFAPNFTKENKNDEITTSIRTTSDEAAV